MKNRTGILVAAMTVAIVTPGCELVINVRDYVEVDQDQTTGAGATGGGGGTAGEGGDGGSGGATGTACIPFTQMECYSGPAGTLGVGACKAGKATCNPEGTAFGPCEGEVVPGPEKPEEIGDEGCDGFAPGEPMWWRTFGGTEDEEPKAIAVSDDGSLFVCGEFDGTIQFGENSPLVSQGASDIFLVKLDVEGVPLWSKSFGNTATQQGCLLAPDEAGGAYIAGDWTGKMFFGGDIVENYGGLAMIARFDAAGNHVWSSNVGEADSVRSITVRGGGDVVAVGAFAGSMQFGSNSLFSTTGTDAYVIQLASSDGGFVWGTSWPDSGGGLSGDDVAVGVAVSSDDRVGVVARISHAVLVGGQSELIATQEYPFVVVQYSDMGVVDWAQLFEFESEDAFDAPLALLPGFPDGMLLALQHSGLSPGGLLVNHLSSASGATTGYKDVPPLPYVLPSGLSVTSKGDLYLGLQVFEAVSLAGQSWGPLAGGGGTANAIFAKLHTEAALDWAGSLAGQLEPGDQQGAPAVAAIPDGSLVLAAGFGQRVTFGGKAMLAFGGNDVVIARFAP